MIIISGASGGLGQYLANHLGKDFGVIGTFQSHARPDTGNVKYHRVDVTDSAAVDRFVSTIAPDLARITFIACAGISVDTIGHKMSDSTWNRVIATNLSGAFFMCRALLPFMRQEQWGRIVLISSVVAQMGVPGTAAYSASKAGLLGLTRTLARENATKNITVNALALGYFDIGMIESIPPEVRETARKSVPMNRFGNPENVSLAVRFLMSADYVTGSVININGGLL